MKRFRKVIAIGEGGVDEAFAEARKAIDSGLLVAPSLVVEGDGAGLEVMRANAASDGATPRKARAPRKPKETADS